MWKDREMENVGIVLVRKRRGYSALFTWLCMYALVVPVHSVNEYYMDDHNDCRYIGLIDVDLDQGIVIHGRRTDVASTQVECTMNFKALDSDANLELAFLSFAVKSCSIKLYISGDYSGNPQTYSCGDPDPQTYYTVGRTITITLHKNQFDNQDYQFMLALTAKRDNKYIPNPRPNATPVPVHSVSNSEYYMDDHNECRFIGLIDVARDQMIVIHGRRTDVASTQGSCTMNFKALDSNANLELQFLSFAVKSCSIKLYISGDASGNSQTYSCGDPDPQTYYTAGRTITITLHKNQFDNQDYQFMLALTARRDNKYIPNSSSNLMVVGNKKGFIQILNVLICYLICWKR